MSKSSRIAVILTFIGASTYASPLLRDTILKAGQAGLFDPEDADKLKSREHRDSRGNLIPYFREEPAGSPYAYDFTKAWADAGNQPRVDSPKNRPLDTVGEKPAGKVADAKPDAEIDTPTKAGDKGSDDADADPDTKPQDAPAAGTEGNTQTDSDDDADQDDDTPADAGKDTAKPAAKTTQRARRTTK